MILLKIALNVLIFGLTTVIVKVMSTHKQMTFVQKVKLGNFNKNIQILKCA